MWEQQNKNEAFALPWVLDAFWKGAAGLAGSQ